MTTPPPDAGSPERVGARAATGRIGLVSRLLGEALRDIAGPPSATGSAAPAVLDCGGGSGTYAVPLASAGFDVTVVDISADALTTLRRRADEAGVSAHVHAVAGDVERLGELFPGRQFDAVLAHGILDAVDDVPATFAEMVAAARPGGLISVLVGNPLASVLARALAGEPGQALAELRALDAPGGTGSPNPGSPDTGSPDTGSPDTGSPDTGSPDTGSPDTVGPDTVGALCAAAGLTVVARHGVGVFSDLVPGAALDSPGARQALADLDAEATDRSPFSDLAARIHLLARRPD